MPKRTTAGPPAPAPATPDQIEKLGRPYALSLTAVLNRLLLVERSISELETAQTECFDALEQKITDLGATLLNRSQ